MSPQQSVLYFPQCPTLLLVRSVSNSSARFCKVSRQTFAVASVNLRLSFLAAATASHERSASQSCRLAATYFSQLQSVLSSGGMYTGPPKSLKGRERFGRRAWQLASGSISSGLSAWQVCGTRTRSMTSWCWAPRLDWPSSRWQIKRDSEFEQVVTSTFEPPSRRAWGRFPKCCPQDE